MVATWGSSTATWGSSTTTWAGIGGDVVAADIVPVGGLAHMNAQVVRRGAERSLSGIGASKRGVDNVAHTSPSRVLRGAE